MQPSTTYPHSPKPTRRHRTPSAWAAGAGLGLLLACVPDGTATGTTTGSAACPEGQEGCPCSQGLCLGELTCASNLCVDLVSATTGAESGGGSTSGSNPTTTGPTTDGPEPVVPCGSVPAPSGMTCIEGGTFINGPGPAFRPNEQLEREVATYWLDTTGVTVADYAACVNAGGPGCTTPLTDSSRDCNWDASGRDNHPINCVDWFQADAYCTWAGKRLPDEWEWEWTARGRDAGRTYPWGEEPPTCLRAVMYDPATEGTGCGAGNTAPVGSKPAGASRDGVLDLAGNVGEWTSSWRDSNQLARVLRGGSWLDDEAGGLLRADFRNAGTPANPGNTRGLRCARTP